MHYVPDWLTVVTFLAIAVMAYLAPVLGYEITNPRGFLRALYLLAGVIATEAVYLYISFSSYRSPESKYEVTPVMYLMLGCKTAAYIIAFCSVILSLRSLRRGDRFPLEPEAISENPNEPGQES